MIKVLVVDDHKFFNEGIISSFGKSSEIEIVDSATTGIKAIEIIQKIHIDVVLLDILMPEMNGIECCKSIKQINPGIKVIAFSGELNTELFFEIWMAKADGILLKTCGLDELVSSIKKVYKGQQVIGTNVPEFFNKFETENNQTATLTRAEHQILKKLACGLTRQETADELFVSINTVNFHCKNIFIKFKDKRINSIISEARRLRMIE